MAVLGVSILILTILKYEQAKNAVYSKNIFAMDTFFTIKVYGEKGEKALADCDAEIQKLEALFSVTREDSDIYRLNQEKTATVSEETLSLLLDAKALCERTEGALDITIYPVLREWGFTTGAYQVPEKEKLQALLERVDYSKITLNMEEKRVELSDAMELDLGAVAKGYTGDRLTEILRNQGVESAILDLGGNVQTIGRKPDGSLWQVAVRNPFDAETEAGVLKLEDQCVITSGSYERYFTAEDGQRYWHILDPSDGYPANQGLVSVTIVGDSGVMCDGLSTALFVMGREKAIDFWKQNRNFEMILIEKDGLLYCTEGLADSFEVNPDWEISVITFDS